MGLTAEKQPQAGSKLGELLETAASLTGESAITSDDFTQLLTAAIQYAQSGAPCGPLPLDAWRSFSQSLAVTMQAAATGDVPAIIHHANAATIAALAITQMPAILLTNRTLEVTP